MNPKKERQSESKESDAGKKKVSRQRIWNIASIAFGGLAVAYGLSSEEHFATIAGAAIAAIGAFKLVKHLSMQRTKS